MYLNLSMVGAMRP